MADITENKPGFFGKALKIIAYPFSVIAGVYVGIASTRDDSYNKLEKVGTFKEILDNRENEIKPLLPGNGNKADITKSIKAIDKRYAEQIETRIKDVGYTSMLKRFGSLHANQKMEVLLKAVGVGGVVLGSLLTIADSKFINRTFVPKSEDENTNKSASR